jgi:hypothetical protein
VGGQAQGWGGDASRYFELTGTWIHQVTSGTLSEARLGQNTDMLMDRSCGFHRSLTDISSLVGLEVLKASNNEIESLAREYHVDTVSHITMGSVCVLAHDDNPHPTAMQSRSAFQSPCMNDCTPTSVCMSDHSQPLLP